MERITMVNDNHDNRGREQERGEGKGRVKYKIEGRKNIVGGERVKWRRKKEEEKKEWVGQGKVREKIIFSRSVKSQGILPKVRESH